MAYQASEYLHIENTISMKKIWVIFVLLGVHYQAFAQHQKKIDSLLKILKNKPSDSKRVDVYNQLARAYHRSDSSKTDMYTSKALQLAREQDYLKGEMDAYCTQGWVAIYKKRYGDAGRIFQKVLTKAGKVKEKMTMVNAYCGLAAIAYYKKIPQEVEKYYVKTLKLLKEMKKWEYILGIYHNMGIFYDGRGDLDKAGVYYKKYLQLSLQLKKKKEMAQAYTFLGALYHRKSEYIRALDYYNQALEIQNTLKDTKGAASSYNDMGIIYDDQGDYKKSLQTYLRGLKIQEKSTDREGLAITINNIGVLFYEQKNYTKALQYYNRNLKVSLEIKDEWSIATAYNNIALVYEHTHQYKKAEAYYQKCIKLGKKSAYEHILGWAYNGMAIIRQKDRKFKEAKEWSDKSVEIRKTLKESENLAQSYNTLGKGFLLQKAYNEALQYYTKAANICKKIGNPLNHKDALKGLSTCYEALGETQKAFVNYKLYHKIADSLINTGNTKNMAYMEAEYAFNKEKDSLELVQQKERKLFATEKRQHKATQRATYVGLGLSLLLGAILLLFYCSKRKSNRKLTLLNQQLSEANTRIVNETNARIETEKEKLRTEVKHKNQQLASQTLHMLQKNQILSELKSLVGEVRKQNNYANATKKFSRLANMIDYGINLDKDWEGFQRVFEQLHPEFYSNIKHQFPGLTSNDLHLCALLKLNLSTREIADLLGIAPESVKVKRYRLRQKMSLDSEKNLHDFMITFDAT